LRSRPSYFLLINACTEIGCGGFVALGDGVVLARAGVEAGECVCADATSEVGDEVSRAGALLGSAAPHATRTRAAGSTRSAFTQPVFPLARSLLLIMPGFGSTTWLITAASSRALTVSPPKKIT
jgi:hypothetical protein